MPQIFQATSQAINRVKQYVVSEFTFLLYDLSSHCLSKIPISIETGETCRDRVFFEIIGIYETSAFVAIFVEYNKVTMSIRLTDKHGSRDYRVYFPYSQSLVSDFELFEATEYDKPTFIITSMSREAYPSWSCMGFWKCSADKLVEIRIVESTDMEEYTHQDPNIPEQMDFGLCQPATHALPECFDRYPF
jgi:hypothetical protein